MDRWTEGQIVGQWMDKRISIQQNLYLGLLQLGIVQFNWFSEQYKWGSEQPGWGSK